MMIKTEYTNERKRQAQDLFSQTIHNLRPFDDWAVSKRPLVLRPYLTIGLPFRYGEIMLST